MTDILTQSDHARIFGLPSAARMRGGALSDMETGAFRRLPDDEQRAILNGRAVGDEPAVQATGAMALGLINAGVYMNVPNTALRDRYDILWSILRRSAPRNQSSMWRTYRIRVAVTVALGHELVKRGQWVVPSAA